MGGSEVDTTLNIGGRIKLTPNFQINLQENFPMTSNPYTYEIDFSPNDPNTYIVCSDQGVFKGNRFNHQVDVFPKIYNTKSLNFAYATAISFSDQGYILIGFSSGSIW